jgi:hypothetical protein
VCNPGNVGYTYPDVEAEGIRAEEAPVRRLSRKRWPWCLAIVLAALLCALPYLLLPSDRPRPGLPTTQLPTFHDALDLCRRTLEKVLRLG